MKSLFKEALLYCLMACAFPTTIMADDITIGDMTLVAGQTATFDVNLDNPSKAYTGFQCDIYLPEGIEYVSYTKNDERLLSQHVLSFTRNSGGFYRLLVYSMPATPVAGTSGAIITITVKTDDTIDTGVKTIDVKNKKFRDSDGGNNIFDNTTTDANVVVEVKIGSSGYCSFSWPRNLDFTGCENFTNVFYGKSKNETSVVVSSIDDCIVPAGTGVIVKGTAGQIVYPNTTAQATEVSSIFTATSSGPITVNTKGEAYALAVINGKTGFYPCNANVTIPQYKCYLPGSVAAKSFIAISQETNNDQIVSDDAGIVDGINNVNADASKNAYYDVQGRRVSTPRHGVYIQNGKKVIIK
ncbi:MAG: hypothetical protein IKX24_04180 [Prevotella sp.]|nr:hypothetical protein [Prevotella sp.]